MMKRKILILDYSTDRSEAPAILQWLPREIETMSLYIEDEESFPEGIEDMGFTHIVHSGSARSIQKEYPYLDFAVQLIHRMRDRGAAQFGICYGHQLLCLALAGKQSVRTSPMGLEAGWNQVEFSREAEDLISLEGRETVFQFHFDEVTELPPGSLQLATGSHTSVQAFINEEQKLLGTQFHPEFDKFTGNRLFASESVLLGEHHCDVKDILGKGPSFNTGEFFFNFFLTHF